MEQIDEILIQLEDQLHGELGNLVTKARKLLAAKTSPPPMPDENALSVELIARYSGNSRGNPIAQKAFTDCYLWMRSQCEGLIKQKAIRFKEWCEEHEYEVDNHAQHKHTTEELYEIFNQQER